MSLPITTAVAPEAVEYPDSDGQPMSDNTLQWEGIVKLKGGLEALFADRPDVFVAGDLHWYAVEGDPKIRLASDALVVFGRPKGYRGSYRQWEEAGIAPQVVFEVLSPGNRAVEMNAKREWYERYGVQEYYVYGPAYDDGPAPSLEGWQRLAGRFEPIEGIEHWRSPLLGVRFEYADGEWVIYRPDGDVFRTYQEQVERELAQREQATRAERQREAERLRAEAAQQQLEVERLRAERLAAKMRQLGIDADA